LYNEYKDEVALRIASDADEHLRRSKGQLKIEMSITEEFLVDLMDEDIIPALKKQMIMSLAPRNRYSLSILFLKISVK
jgi:hypothetical protein